MTALEQSLRVDISKLRQEGVNITVPEPINQLAGVYKTAQDELKCPRGWHMTNITDAVQEYKSRKVKYRGLVKDLAIKFHTTPGSIRGRIRRNKS